jgi:hypothetical protein
MTMEGVDDLEVPDWRDDEIAASFERMAGLKSAVSDNRSVGTRVRALLRVEASKGASVAISRGSSSWSPMVDFLAIGFLLDIDLIDVKGEKRDEIRIIRRNKND